MTHLRPALVLIVLLTLITGLAFPLGLVAAGRAVIPGLAGGSLIERNGTVVGSALLGQNFTADKYIHGRPSATTDTDPADSTKTVPAPYNAGNSGGSNAGPTAASLIDRVKTDLAGATSVPGDMATTSASGLDPHISPATAALQVARVAAARNLPEARVREVLAGATSGRLFGLIGEPRVDVLAANLALDAAK